MIDTPCIEGDLTPELQQALRGRLLGMRSGTAAQRLAADLLRKHGLRAIVDGPHLDEKTFALLCRAGCSPQDSILGWAS